MLKRNLFFLVISMFILIGCGGGGSSSNGSSNETNNNTVSTSQISGYVEDDAIPNAVIVLKDIVGNIIGQTKADSNGFYTLNAAFENSKIYYIEATGSLGNRNVTMNSVFIFEQNSMNVNINPLMEIVYQLYQKQKTSEKLEDINKRVLQEFALVENSKIHNIRFSVDSDIYIFMKKIAGEGLPIDAVSSLVSEIENGTTELRSILKNKIEIIPSSTSVEVNDTISLTLNKSIFPEYKIVWYGLDKVNMNDPSQSLTSKYPGDRIITVQIFNNEILLDESSMVVNFYKTGEPVDINITDNSIDTNATVDDIKVSILKGSLPSGVNKITVSNIENSSDSILRTIKLEPSGTVFNNPIIVTIPFDLSTVEDPSTLYIERIESDGRLEILKPEIDYKNQQLIFKTDHFSYFKIVKPKDGRSYIGDKWGELDLEDDFFFKKTDYGIGMMSGSIGFEDLLEYMINKKSDKSPLQDDIVNNMKSFYAKGWDGINNFNSDYEEAMKYVLAEPVSKGSTISKYELLVDSVKKYKLANMIDSYMYKDMLTTPYKGLISTTTRSDFFNEIIKIEDLGSDEYGIGSSYLASGLKGFKSLKSDIDLAKKIKNEYINLLQDGFAITGSKLAYSYLYDYISKELKYSITKHFTNKNLSYLQCFNIEEGYDDMSYKIGQDTIFTVSNDNQISNINTGPLVAFVDYITYGIDVDGTLDQEGINFGECITKKMKKLSEDKTLTGNFATGLKVLADKKLRNELAINIKELAKMLNNRDLGSYLSVLKIINFDKNELNEYSKHLKYVAAINAAPIIESIMIEKMLIEGKTYKDMTTKNAGFFNDKTLKNEAFAKFVKYYKKRSISTSSSETTEKLKVYSLEDFKNYKLSIDSKFMPYFSLDLISLDINTVNLKRKISTDGIISSYYESDGEFRNLKLSKNDISSSNYILNEKTGKYEITLGKLFESIDVGNPSYLDVQISLNMTYKGKKLYLEKMIDFIADDKEDLVVTPVERGEIKVIVKDESMNNLEGASVKIGSSNCLTDVDGSCTIKNLIPSEYEVIVGKEGYLPNFKKAFIDVGINKELDFTVKSYDENASIFLDVSPVRSEAKPLEYSFYITALGDDLNMSINFGDGIISSGSYTSLLEGKSYIAHSYSSGGVKNVEIMITNAVGETRSSNLKVYPVTSEKVVDAVFLVDLSGSYGSSLSNFQIQATEIANSFSTLGSDVRIGLSSFDDFPEWTGDSNDFAYKENQKLTYDFDMFHSTLNSLMLNGGGDYPESQLESLYQIATTFNWRDSSEKYIFIATDASFHNSDIETTYPGKGYSQTLAALKAKGIKVIGLNRGDYNIEDVTTITTDTGGTVFNLDSASSDIVEKILNFTNENSVESRNLVRKRIVGSLIQGNAN